MSQITANAFNLVQDPFGNYVVQYIRKISYPNLLFFQQLTNDPRS